MAVPVSGAVLLAGATGCGQDDSRTNAKTTQIKPAPTLPALPTTTAPLPPATKEPKPAGKPKKRAKRRGGVPEASPGSSPAAPPPPPDPAKAVRRAIADTLDSAGYGGADVDVAGGGDVVTVAVKSAQACKSKAQSADQLVTRIKEAAPDARSVRIKVSGSGQSLTTYQRLRCDNSQEEETGGDVVYSKKGSGPFTTPAFSVAGDTWTVSYRNDSDFFEASVLKGGKTQPFLITSRRRGSGSETFRGPGRFQLKIRGEGWSVTVRDGG